MQTVPLRRRRSRSYFPFRPKPVLFRRDRFDGRVLCTSCFSRRSAVAAIGSGPSSWMQLEAQRRISRPFLALHEPLGDRGAKKSATLCQEREKSTVGQRRGWNRRQGPPGANGFCRESGGCESRLAAAFADCCLQILHSQCSLCISARVKSCQSNAGGVLNMASLLFAQRPLACGQGYARHRRPRLPGRGRACPAPTADAQLLMTLCLATRTAKPQSGPGAPL